MRPSVSAILIAALLAGPAAAELPDLAGRAVTVVTENAYPPLQFVDPATGAQIGWEYDAMDEIAQRLNLDRHLRECELGGDDPGGVGGPVRHRDGRDHHP